MKKLYTLNKNLFVLLGVLLAFGCSSLLTSCVPGDDDYWPFYPPSDWGTNYFYDRQLEGSWELRQINGYTVTGYETNYMDFYGGGHGRYYSYVGGRLVWENMAYFCQYGASTSSTDLINIQYSYGDPSTMSYWFSDNYSLWLQWRDNRTGTVQTYLYERINAIPRSVER